MLGEAKHDSSNCSLNCLDNKQVLRSPTDITLLYKRQVFGEDVGPIRVFTVIVSVAAIFWLTLSWFLLPGKNSRQGPRTCIIGRVVMILITVFVTIPLLIRNELYLLKDGGLPSTENVFEIGQWGTWVSVALVLVGALVVRYQCPAFWGRQRTLDHEQAASDTGQEPTALGNRGSTMCGVPSPQDLSLPHVISPGTSIRAIRGRSIETASKSSEEGSSGERERPRDVQRGRAKTL